MSTTQVTGSGNGDGSVVVNSGWPMVNMDAVLTLLVFKSRVAFFYRFLLGPGNRIGMKRHWRWHR